MGVALLTPSQDITPSGIASNAIVQHTFVGLRFDYLAHQAFASTMAVGIKGDMQLWRHNFEGFFHSGANIPFSGFGIHNGDIGAMVGGGVYTSIFTFTHGSIGFQGSAEKWTQFTGAVFHFGPVANFTW